MENLTWSTMNSTLGLTTDTMNLTHHNTTDTALNYSTTLAPPRTGGGGGPSLPWANPSNVMSKETSDNITFSLQCFVFPILTVFGITGNILSMIVMLQKKLRESTTTIVLVGLAISDILFLGTNMIRKSSCIIREFDSLLADAVNAKTFRYAFYFKTAFSRVSTLLVVVISLERLIAVALPLSVKTIVTKTRMIITVVACNIIVLASLAGLPPQYTHATVGGRVYISQTEFSFDNVDSLKIYNEYFLPITFRYIPVLVVLILNIAIIILLKRSRNFQKKSAATESKRDDEQRKITRVLLTVSIIYLICLLPGDILLLCSDLIEGFSFFGIYHNVFLALSDISLLFEIVNSSINFIIYMLLNRRFSETYKRLFCPCAGPALTRRNSRYFTSKTTKSTLTADPSIASGKDNKGFEITEDETSTVYQTKDVKDSPDDHTLSNAICAE